MRKDTNDKCCLRTYIYLCFLAFLVFSKGLSGFAQAGLADQGVEFQVNQDGLQSIASEIHSRVLTPIRNMPLPDINTTVDYGIKVRASGLNFSLDFTSLVLRSDTDSLNIAVGIRNVLINVPRIRASKKVIWDISTTCKNTQIKIAHQNALVISPKVPVWLDGDQIRLNLDHVNFDIPDQEFQVSGPSECSGALGIGHLIRSIMSRVLGNSKNMIRNAIVDQVKKLKPVLEQELNQLAHQSVNLRSQPVPGLPALEGSLHLKPYQIQLTPDSFRLAFSVGFSDALSEFSQEVPEIKLLASRLLLGSVGINPLLIQEAFSLWMDGTGGSVSLDGLEAAQELVSPSVAALIWPELLRSPESVYPLKLSLTFAELPELTVNPQTQQITIHSERVLLNITAGSGSGERLFYQITMSVTLKPELILDGDLLYLRLTQRPEFSFEGHWPDSWIPENAAVNRVLLEQQLTNLTSHLWQEGEPLYYMFVPTIFTGSQFLQLDQLRYDEPYMKVSVFQTDSP